MGAGTRGEAIANRNIASPRSRSTSIRTALTSRREPRRLAAASPAGSAELLRLTQAHAQQLRGCVVLRKPRRNAAHQPRRTLFREHLDAAIAEIDHDLMMAHALAALDQAKVAHQAIMPIAHTCQSGVLEHG